MDGWAKESERDHGRSDQKKKKKNNGETIDWKPRYGQSPIYHTS
jgi:hypothetical protein